MARVPTFIFIGNSNMDGLGQLLQVPTADLLRWIGTASPLTTYPAEAQVPGVKLYTSKMPYGVTSTRNITAVGGSTVTVDGAAPVATDVDTWVYIKTNTTGQGQLRKVSGVAGQVLTVSVAWAPAIAANGTIQMWTDSHTLAGAQTSVLLTKSGTTVDFPVSVVGQWVEIISGTGVLQVRRILSRPSVTTIVPEEAFSPVPVAGDGIRVLSGTNSAQSLVTYTAGAAIRNLTFSYDLANTYTTGFEYNNFKGQPGQVSNLLINCIPELTWQLRSYYGTPVYGLPFGIDASQMAPNNIGTTFHIATFAWLYDVTHLDFHPASPTSLYSTLLLAIANMAALAAPDLLDIQGIFATIVENDCRDANVAAKVGANLALIKSSLCTFIAAGNYSTRQAGRIPFLVSSATTTAATYLYTGTANTQIAQLAADDPYFGVVDTAAFTYEADNLHFNALGLISLGKAYFTQWKAIIERENSATRVLAELPTLSAIRTKVKRRYERNNTSNDATSAQVDMFINDSLREVYNTLGDSAWFLRRIETVSLSSTYPAVLTLPRAVKRLLRIERSSCPGQTVVWKGLSYTDQGRLQITLHDYAGGPYLCHFIALPQDLVTDGDVSLVPNDYLELVVMLTCKRLTECAGNMSLAQYYAAETERLWRYVKRNVLSYDRMRQESLTTVDTYDSWRVGGSRDWIEGL